LAAAAAGEECRIAVGLGGPPHVPVAEALPGSLDVGGGRLLNPRLRDHLLTGPAAVVEVEESEGREVLGSELREPGAFVVALRVDRPGEVRLVVGGDVGRIRHPVHGVEHDLERGLARDAERLEQRSPVSRWTMAEMTLDAWLL